MTRVLFVTWDGGRNVPPAIEMANELLASCAEVRFLGHESQRSFIEAAGFPFEAYTSARKWSVLTPWRAPLAPLAYAAVFTDRGIGRDLLASLKREPADKLVIDGLLIGALDAAAHGNYPYFVLVHSLRHVMIRTLMSGPLALIMRLRRLAPAQLYAGAEGEIVAALASLDPGSGQAPETAVYVGPGLPAIDARVLSNSEQQSTHSSLRPPTARMQTALAPRSARLGLPAPLQMSSFHRGRPARGACERRVPSSVIGFGDAPLAADPG